VLWGLCFYLMSGKEDEENHEDYSLTFQDYYVNEMTEGFAEELDKIRTEETHFDENKMDIMVDMLRSGVNIFSDIEQQLALEGFDYLKTRRKMKKIRKTKDKSELCEKSQEKSEDNDDNVSIIAKKKKKKKKTSV